MALGKDTHRKVVNLSSDLLSRINIYQEKNNIASEGEAFRQLIELGLNTQESNEDISMRCRIAKDEGKSFGWIIANILDNLPQVVGYEVTSKGLTVTFSNADVLVGKKDSDKWHLHLESGGVMEIYYIPF
ncbi:hypothetical protein [Curvivirga aplysinae]|uniref:hypothetical protein n=1 Tax=Curvivirga aplysinae TaxID=2529852 RepID=UPI0012BB6EF1|nr:hypothetical protein [Curvivirga aplysinae]MTI10187.1 hypothetical protein [Curvivirga aplysinae]